MCKVQNEGPLIIIIYFLRTYPITVFHQVSSQIVLIKFDYSHYFEIIFSDPILFAQKVVQII